MSEELTDLLKELVNRIKRLETTVYNADNVLLKAGLIKIETPKPVVNANPTGLPDAETIAKMDWTEIDALVSNLKGN
tara:strand:+ start:7391 stop:7621 length:231 start_codon:yes stop_codon:yes gene_type:complete